MGLTKLWGIKRDKEVSQTDRWWKNHSTQRAHPKVHIKWRTALDQEWGTKNERYQQVRQKRPLEDDLAGKVTSVLDMLTLRCLVLEIQMNSWEDRWIYKPGNNTEVYFSTKHNKIQRSNVCIEYVSPKEKMCSPMYSPKE